jgi:hypothetical protein
VIEVEIPIIVQGKNNGFSAVIDIPNLMPWH